MKINPFSYFPLVSSASVCRATIVACGLLAGTNSAFAAAKTWTGTTDGDWTVGGLGGNWNGETPPAATGDNLIFNTSANTTIINMPTTLSLSGTALLFNVGSSAFTIGTSASTVTFTGGGVTNSGTSLQILNFNINTNGTQRTFSTNSGGITINGDIAGAGGISKTNAGTLTLNGTNNIYSGVTSLTGGMLVVANSASLGTSSLTLGAATLQASADLSGANKLAAAVTLTGTGIVSGSNNIEFGGKLTGSGTSKTLTSSITGGNTLTLNDVDISNTVGNARSLTFNGSGATVINGVIANGTGTNTANSLLIQGTGTTTINGSGNTYSGGTTLSGGASLVIGADSTPSTANATVTSGPLGTGTLTFGIGTISAGTTGRTIANQVQITNTATTIVGGSNNMTFNGKVTFLGGTNTFLTSSNSAATTYGGGITIRDDGSTATRFPTLSNTGSGAMIISAPIINGSTLDGVINIGGTGIVQLNAANTYSGNTNILAGATARIGNAAGLAYGGPVSNVIGFSTNVTSGGTVDLNGQSTVNEPFIINGTGVGGNGALINSNTGATAVIGNSIAGAMPGAALSGSGYDNTTTVTIAAPGGGGTTATATASLGLTSSSFSISSNTTTYSAAPTVTITGGGGVGATATAVLDGGGSVIGVTITSNGKDFTSAPTIAFSGGTVLSAGTNPTGTGNATNFGLRAIAMTGAGSGYTSAPVVTISGTGSGATATSTITSVNLATASSIGGAGDITVNAVVSGTGMTKVGAGKVTLAGTNTYTGGTTISNGTLLVNGSISTGNVTVANTAKLGGTGVIGGAITVDSGGKIAPGSSVGTLAASSNVTFSGGSSLEIELNASTSDRLNVTNTLDITGATLNITSLVPAAAPVYIIASYGTLAGAGFVTVNGLPSGYELQTNYNSLHQIALVQTGGLTPYQLWATSPPYNLAGADALPGADPDNDGVKNILEFALNSNPTSGSSQGLSFSKMATVGVTPKVLTLTIATRNGAVFSASGNRQKSAVVDGIIYTIEASNTLVDWGGPVVTEVTGGDATIIQSGLPTPGTGWSYKTFRTDGSADSDTVDFIRTVVE